MLIDWFTVVAQIVNFLVLVLLLKYLLYGRIIKAMDRREAQIAHQLEEAQAKREESEREAQTYQQKNQELKAKGEELLTQARHEAEARRKELIQKAREEVGHLQQRWQESVQREKDLFLRDLKQRASQQVYAIARRTLKEVANADLEGRIIDVFIEQIHNLDEKKRKKISDSLRSARRPVVVYSAFEIPSGAREKVNEAVRRHLEDGVELQYRTSPDILLGIEMEIDGHKVAWSLDHYFDALEARIAEAIEEETEEVSRKKEALKG